MTPSSRKAALAALFLTGVSAALGAIVWLKPSTPEPLPVAPTPAVPEDEALIASHGLVTRQGPVLKLKMKSGETLELTDRRQCGDLPCVGPLNVSYRYLGWNEAIGGYLLSVTMANSQQMVLTYGDDDPILIDARHGAEAKEPLPMPTQSASAPQTDASLAEWLSDMTAEREQSEKPLMAAHPDKIERHGGKLSIALGDKRHLVLEDDLVCGQLACPPQISRSYDYLGASPDNRFQVVRQQWNEAEVGLLIGEDGAVSLTASVPSFAPDGKVAVAVISDLEGNSGKRLEVWDLAKAKPALLFSVAGREEDDTVYELVGWVDAHHLRLKRGPWGSDRRTAVMLVGDATGWHVEEGE